MQAYLKTIADGGTLSTEQSEQAMHLMMRGEVAPEEVAGFLMGLRARGETVEELVGFTRVMRQYAVQVSLDDPHAIDLCGTGGDNTGTFNISTAAMFVCAGAGATVAKHGNRSVSSRSGSADVLEALGVNVQLKKQGVEYCLREAGVAFIFAPFFHPAMRFVMPVRKKLGARTFFNILGPLSNPAGVKRQLVGAFSKEVARTVAHILARLDADHVIAIHSNDGLDEISLAEFTNGFEFRTDNHMENRTPHAISIKPEQYNLELAALDLLKGGTAEENAALLRLILAGKSGPHRDVVLLNSAYGLLVSGRFADLDECLTAARTALDSGAAQKSLQTLIEVSNDAPRDVEA